MKKRKLLIVVIALFCLISCSPDELLLIKDIPFMVKNMDPTDIPVVQVNKVIGATKTFSIYASHELDSIASFTATEQSQSFTANPIVFKMIDPSKPVTISNDGKLSRKLSAVVFEYTVQIPKTFVEGKYSVKFNITTGKGEQKSIVAKLQASSFLASNVGLYFNGQVASSNRVYSLTANSFFGFTTVTTNVIDATVTPSVTVKVPTSINLVVTTVGTAITAANRVYVYGHIYTDLTNYDKRSMYLVSPKTSWIPDSLRTLNLFKGTYPTAQMQDVKYLELGPVDFATLKVSDLVNKQIGTVGSSQVLLIKGNAYAFLTKEGKIAVLYVKNILYYTPSYAIASPTAYLWLKVEG